ncbi:MAG: hypothetical protein HY423_09435 [Candidatus Lambdaproteobacteria bacterium]|nr:hypothetical protein [Candidatus Lambdaproteobacteria bacterium]
MELDKSKRKQQEEIERARRSFYAQGRRVSYLRDAEDAAAHNAKPRKTRLCLLA